MRTKDDIRAFARGLNIDLVGFTDADPLDARPFEAWLAAGRTAGMSWLSRHPRDRFTPSTLLPGAQSVISIGMSYFRGPSPSGPIARYAHGRDYHTVLQEKLALIEGYLLQAEPGLRTRRCVDSAPLAEKPLAQKAGLGWQGRHSLLINPVYGSWIVLGELILTHPYPPDPPAVDQCGACRVCLEACPTGAIRDDRTIAADRCLAYLTIEHKGQTQADLHGRILGCDLCQEACPWNADPTPTREPAFRKLHPLAKLTIAQLTSLSRAEYMQARQDSAFARISYDQLHRNIARGYPQHPTS